MIQLIAMRLADMERVHPDQDNSRTCAKCGAQVGIYPSGQRALAARPSGIRIICHICAGPATVSVLVPGALEEPFESMPAKR